MLLNWDRAVKKMDEYGLDAVVAAAPRNVYYASGILDANVRMVLSGKFCSGCFSLATRIRPH